MNRSFSEQYQKDCVFILPSLRKGGAEKVFSMLANELNSYLIVVESCSTEQIKSFGISESQVISLNKQRVLSALFPLIRLLKSLKSKTIFSTHTHLNIIVLLTSFFVRGRFVIRESSVFSKMSLFSKEATILKILMKALYPFADVILCQSKDIHYGLKQMLRCDENKYAVINNPIRVDELPCRESANKKVLNLVYTARFAPGKGHDRLIPILKHLNRPYKLFLIGDGAEFEKTKSEFKKAGLYECVEFLGEVIPPYPKMIKCDVYIQPSYVEGFPNALMEAAAMGLMLIAYDVPGGTKEIINDVNGILIEDGNAIDFAKAINNYDEDKFDKYFIRNDISKRFGIKEIAKKYKTISE